MQSNTKGETKKNWAQIPTGIFETLLAFDRESIWRFPFLLVFFAITDGAGEFRDVKQLLVALQIKSVILFLT